MGSWCVFAFYFFCLDEVSSNNLLGLGRAPVHRGVPSARCNAINLECPGTRATHSSQQQGR
jgi:hypothetical protein